MLVVLRRVEPDEKMDRWYLVTVQRTLLDPVAVVCQYGSRHTSWQQTRVLPAASREEAEALAGKIVAAKLRRGYIDAGVN